MKRHLAHPDQSTERWVGAILFRPGRGHVVTRCGRTVWPAHPPYLARDRDDRDTCGSCRRSPVGEAAVPVKIPADLLRVLGALAEIEHLPNPGDVIAVWVVPMLREYACHPEVQRVMVADRRLSWDEIHPERTAPALAQARAASRQPT